MIHYLTALFLSNFNYSHCIVLDFNIGLPISDFSATKSIKAISDVAFAQ